MTLWTKEELLESLNSELIAHNLNNQLNINEVVIDSRKAAPNKIFIALKGENHDAHKFLNQVFSNGCEIAIIDNPDKFDEFKTPLLKNKLILVKNTFIALYKIAEFSRNRSKAKIIGITGSVGKTGTKEILNIAFTTQGKTYTTLGNLNNHIGLPLSLSNFSRDCDYGIFEMGMNHLGEIEVLSKLAKPHLAIITNIGPVHIENFKNEQEIAFAKSEIFSGVVKNGIALLNQDNQHFEFVKNRANYFEINQENIVSFGEKTDSDYKIISSEIKNVNLSEVKVRTKKNIEISYEISTSHKATIFNSIIVLACLDLLGNDIKKGIETFKNIKSFKGRGEILELEIDNKKLVVIDDSYNASVLSMKSGLEHAINLKNSLKKNRIVAALGDMLELGEKSQELHEEVIEYVKNYKIDFVILVGEKMTIASQKLDKNIYKIFSNSKDAANSIKNLLQDEDILYVKGSHSMKMDMIIENLSAQINN
jgi:UDP-N-acetylmuramoyl-tripeptide--D-alanyl-D-alanine ligase